MIRIDRSTERFALRMAIEDMGRDLNVSLCGGDSPHIGAVALAVPRPSLRHPDLTSASVSVVTVTGHKEDDLARSVGRALASTLGRTVAVSCGIHLDNAAEREIDQVLQLVSDMVAEAEERLSGPRNEERT